MFRLFLIGSLLPFQMLIVASLTFYRIATTEYYVGVDDPRVFPAFLFIPFWNGFVLDCSKFAAFVARLMAQTLNYR